MRNIHRRRMLFYIDWRKSFDLQSFRAFSFVLSQEFCQSSSFVISKVILTLQISIKSKKEKKSGGIPEILNWWILFEEEKMCCHLHGMPWSWTNDTSILTARLIYSFSWLTSTRNISSLYRKYAYASVRTLGTTHIKVEWYR